MSHNYDRQNLIQNPPMSSTSYLRDPMDRFESVGSQRRPPNLQSSYFNRPYADDPPPYPSYISPASSYSKCKPRNWGRRTWIVVAIGFVILLIIIIVAAVEGVKANAYPDYSPLNYQLVDTLQGSSFFDNFDYFTGNDPTQGFVHYSSPEQSQQMNLTFVGANSVGLRVDNTQTNATTGRYSARISSKKQYDSGLFLFDVLHTPYGCASWPAVWLTDQNNWPQNGEIDVIESVNRATTGNRMTLHTTDDCSMDVRRELTGTILNTDCYNGTDGNAGCGVRGPKNTFGATLNKAGGGVYAMELRAAGIRIWFFPRNNIPKDIQRTTKPRPEKWGTPLADFPSTDCDISSHFKNQSITVNIDVCGTWAGSPRAYSKVGSCPGDCVTYAATHPQAFDESYWEFASFKVYQAK